MNQEEKTEILKVDFECPACEKIKKSEKKIPVRRIIEKLDECFKTNDLCDAEKLLLYWQKEAAQIGDLSGELSIVNEQLGLYRKISKVDEGFFSVERAKELIKLLDIGNTVSGATILLNAATTYKAFGEAQRAIPLYKEAETVYHKNLDKTDLRLAALYNNYATALVDLGQCEEAEILYKKAVKLTEQTTESLPDCAVTYVNMAHLYEKCYGADSEKVTEVLGKAETILEDGQVCRNSYYAFVCEKCAPSFDYFGFFWFAQKLKERAKKIYEGP